VLTGMTMLGLQMVTGSVSVTTSALQILSLPSLRVVGGSLVLSNLANIQRAEFPNLERIEDDFRILASTGFASMTVLALPSLRIVNNDIDLNLQSSQSMVRPLNNMVALNFSSLLSMGSFSLACGHDGCLTNLQKLDFPMLNVISGSFSIATASAPAASWLRSLGHITAPHLSEIGGSLSCSFQGGISANGRNVNLHFPTLSRINGSLTFTVSGSVLPGVTKLEFPALQEVGSSSRGDVSISGLPALVNLSLPLLASIHGSLSLSNLPVSSLAFPSLQTIGGRHSGSLAVSGMSALSLVSSPSLNTINGSLSMTSLPLFVSWQVGQLQTLNGITIQTTGLPLLTFLSSISANLGSLLVTGNPSLVLCESFRQQLISATRGTKSIQAEIFQC
jgi:hypothetical protein